MNKKIRVTNRQYAESDQTFRSMALTLARKMGKEIETFATTRQASKFRRGFGIVYQSASGL